MITKSIYKLPSIKATFLTCTFLSVYLSTKSFVHEQCSINSIVSWQEGKFPSGLVEARLENMLVCCQTGCFFSTPDRPIVYQFEMEKVALILIYLMIFKFFIPLNTVCLLLLQCACYHYDFSLL